MITIMNSISFIYLFLNSVIISVENKISFTYLLTAMLGLKDSIIIDVLDRPDIISIAKYLERKKNMNMTLQTISLRDIYPTFAPMLSRESAR